MGDRIRTGQVVSHPRVRGAGRAGDPLRIVAATEGRKADGLDLRMDRARLGRYRANPVVLYGHRGHTREDLPIGRATEVWTDGPRLMADIVFDQTDEFAVRVESKYRAGILNAFSIGFDVSGVSPSSGVPDTWQLNEISAVVVPMDPSAVVAGGRELVGAGLRSMSPRSRQRELRRQERLARLNSRAAAIADGSHRFRGRVDDSIRSGRLNEDTARFALALHEAFDRHELAAIDRETRSVTAAITADRLVETNVLAALGSMAAARLTRRQIPAGGSAR